MKISNSEPNYLVAVSRIAFSVSEAVRKKHTRGLYSLFPKCQALTRRTSRQVRLARKIRPVRIEPVEAARGRSFTSAGAESATAVLGY